MPPVVLLVTWEPLSTSAAGNTPKTNYACTMGTRLEQLCRACLCHYSAHTAHYHHDDAHQALTRPHNSPPQQSCNMSDSRRLPAYQVVPAAHLAVRLQQSEPKEVPTQLPLLLTIRLLLLCRGAPTPTHLAFRGSVVFTHTTDGCKKLLRARGWQQHNATDSQQARTMYPCPYTARQDTHWVLFGGTFTLQKHYDRTGHIHTCRKGGVCTTRVASCARHLTTPSMI